MTIYPDLSRLIKALETIEPLPQVSNLDELMATLGGKVIVSEDVDKQPADDKRENRH